MSSKDQQTAPPKDQHGHAEHREPEAPPQIPLDEQISNASSIILRALRGFNGDTQRRILRGAAELLGLGTTNNQRSTSSSSDNRTNNNNRTNSR